MTVWDDTRARLAGQPGGGLNIAVEAVDRHVAEGRGQDVALRFVGRHGERSVATFAGLSADSGALADLLGQLGTRPGDAVFTLLGRVPELYVTALGTWKARAVLSPLFSAFGPEPVAQRLALGRGRVLVTTEQLYRRKVAPVRDRLPDLEHVLLVGGSAGGVPGGTAFDGALARGDRAFVVPRTDPQDPALLHFTSGTTGTPKGAVHVHEAVVAHAATAAGVLGLRRGDVYWCTADPGWVTGTSYGIIAPLVLGATSVVDAGDFEARRWYELLAAERVEVWYTAPTALRMLMRAGDELAGEHDLSALRHVASVGEPLNGEVVLWSARVLGHPVHDTWWQTETGAIMIGNPPGEAPVPGSMGRPVPGIEAAVLARGDDGRARVTDGAVEVLTDPDQVGELALRPPWPSMFRGYWGAPERYAAAFADGWYLTGDLARVDSVGRFWFVGRADDVIKSAGHLVGPFEVESVLMEHPAVVEAGVIGKPDPVAGELVKAFVTLRSGVEPDEALRADILAFGRRRLGSVAPREIDFDQNLPHTRSGKVMRRLLRARELGLPEGDLSTLEGRS
ncbi:acetate--CoA ligase [Quadrisphaera sp. GCM10027208]|uniref:acetate--CoA ligase n=1 Tax=Quadrisphaera sp. GCM10027208 TaxID=3273423 RepID=UPI0036208455